jgi:hypothetical protein
LDRLGKGTLVFAAHALRIQLMTDNTSYQFSFGLGIASQTIQTATRKIDKAGKMLKHRFPVFFILAYLLDKRRFYTLVSIVLF